MSGERLPDALPVLRKGRHASPDEGACLMEYVSILAGERFTDSPACVDPLLVRLAWVINDTAADEVRAALPELAPRLIGTANTSPLTAPAIVHACCTFARSYLDPAEDSVLARAERRSEARLRRVHRGSVQRRGMGDRLFRLHADLALHESARVIVKADATALPGLLLAAVSAVRAELADVPPTVPAQRSESLPAR